MNSGLLRDELAQKRKIRGLTDAELCIYDDLQERGEPDLRIHHVDDPITKWITEIYIQFCKNVIGIELFHTQINFSARVFHTIVHGLGHHITALFARQCVAGHTVVLNQNGQYVKIKDMVDGEFGDAVGIDEEMHRALPATITRFHKNGEAQTYLLTTESGFEIPATSNHPFFVRTGKIRNLIQGKWKRLNQIKLGHKVAVYKSTPVFGDFRRANYEVEALAYFFGANHKLLDWFAEKEKLYPYASMFRLSEVERIMNEFGDIMTKESQFKGGIKPDSKILRWVADQNRDGLLPEWVEMLNKKQLRLFLSRFFAERVVVKKVKAGVKNGPQLKPEHTHIVTIRGDKETLYQVKLLLLKFSVQSILKPTHGTAETWTLKIDKYEMPRFLYEINPYRVKNLHPPEKMSKYNRHITWERVTAIKKAEIEHTYDVTVEVKSTTRRFWYGKGVTKKIFHNLFENGFVCHNSGKTQSMACIMFFMSVMFPILAKHKSPKISKLLGQWVKGYWCGIYAPILEQSQTTFLRLKSVITPGSLLQFGLTAEINNGNTFALSNGSKVMAGSASDNSNIESKSWHSICVEEAQDVSRRKIQKSIVPMTAFYGGSMIFVGTSTDKSCQFLDEIEFNQRHYPKDHFAYDYRHICYVHRPYFQHVCSEVERYGWDSDFIRMSYRLHWVLEHGQFVTPGNLFKCQRKDLEAGMLLKSSYPKFVGIDVAKDPAQTVGTVGMIRDGDRIILDWIALGGEDYTSQSFYLSAWLSGINNVRAVYVDSTSKDGDSMTEMLSEKCPRLRIVPIKFSPSSKNDMYRCLDLVIKGESDKPQFYYPAGNNTRKKREYKDFLMQMLDLQKDYKGGLLVVHKPDKRNVFDDYGDSVALMVYASYQESAVVLTGATPKKTSAKDRFGNKQFAQKSFRGMGEKSFRGL